MLRGVGVRRGDRVAVIGSPGLDVAIAILGTLQAAIAAPLDRTLPSEALREHFEH
jgi:acyl-CoA synthetase (AMP-forming)/AMP-acid ligase II